MCRSRRELLNAYLLAKFGFDTAENEPFFATNVDEKSCCEVYILWYLVATSFALETGIDAISLGVWGIEWTELYSVVGSSTPDAKFGLILS